MFGALREKLKGWLSKSKEQEEEKPTPKEKKETKKNKKEQEQKKKTPTKEQKKKGRKEEKTAETIIEETEQEEDIKKIAPSFVEEVAAIQQENEEQEKKEKKSFFSLFKKELTKEKFEELFEELELILLQNNIAYEAVTSIKKNLEENLIGKNPKQVNLPKELEQAISNLLVNPPNFLETIKKTLKEKTPFIILFAGINGSGKTTTIAKIARYLQKNKLSVCLAAGDTFRAASIEQLQQHANNLNIPLIKKDYGSDPAAVGFDAVTYAKKNHIDVVLIDTAGRMQNKDSLMKEMEKIARVNKPDMKIFLGESITGNDATEQAKAFNEAINLTGIILSKADVDEKGGTAISVSYITGKPILFLGTGQTYEDLEVFNKEKLLQTLGL